MVIRALIITVVAGFMFSLGPIHKAAAIPGGLFGSVELPAGVPWEWQRAMQKMKVDWHAMSLCRDDRSQCASPAMRAWRDRLDALQHLEPRVQLERLNAFVNQEPYVADDVNFGQLDHYASVSEFLEKSGDCEDFAIAKYFFLRALGFADADLRLVIVIRTFDRMPHAVLAVYLESGVFILDNETSEIVRAEELDSYQPVQSFNASRGWVHLPS